MNVGFCAAAVWFDVTRRSLASRVPSPAGRAANTAHSLHGRDERCSCFREDPDSTCFTPRHRCVRAARGMRLFSSDQWPTLISETSRCIRRWRLLPNAAALLHMNPHPRRFSLPLLETGKEVGMRVDGIAPCAAGRMGAARRGFAGCAERRHPPTFPPFTAARKSAAGGNPCARHFPDSRHPWRKASPPPSARGR